MAPSTVGARYSDVSFKHLIQEKLGLSWMLALGQVYTMVSHVVSEHTSLLYGRHLDQVILCALYGVCKVNQLKHITFKDIITHYKKQAQAKNSIFRTVSIQLTPDLQVIGPHLPTS